MKQRPSAGSVKGLCCSYRLFVLAAIGPIEPANTPEKRLILKLVEQSVRRIMQIDFDDPDFPLLIDRQIYPALEGKERVMLRSFHNLVA